MQLPSFIQRWLQGPGNARPPADLEAGSGIRIARDQMRHGVVVLRGREEVRQVALILRGQLHLVTSGDVVEPWVYDALVARGVLLPAADRIPPVSRGAA